MNDIYSRRYVYLLGDHDPVSPNCRLGGNVKIGHGAVIEKDCVIGDEVTIGHHSVIEQGATIGSGTIIKHGSIIESNCNLGKNVFIGHNSVLRNDVTIGDNSIVGHLVMTEADAWLGKKTTIQSQCHITKFAKIDDHCFLGPKAMLINTMKISHGRGFEPDLRGPHVNYAARVGSGSIIMPGVIIGQNAVAGAGAVVTKNIPDFEIWFGNPAKFQYLVSKNEILEKK
jgi:acetyltransferase-like isoleucine patch superfamily enzyme